MQSQQKASDVKLFALKLQPTATVVSFYQQQKNECKSGKGNTPGKGKDSERFGKKFESEVVLLKRKKDLDCGRCVALDILT